MTTENVRIRNILVTPWSHHRPRKWGLAVAVLTLLFSACAVFSQPTNQLTDPPINAPITQPTSRDWQFAIRDLQGAAYNYARYHTLVPDDLLGLKRLAEVCTALEEAGVQDKSCREAALQVSGFTSQVEGNLETLDLKLETSPAVVLGEALEVRTDGRRIVSELLGVPVEDVELGPNLVKNGALTDWLGSEPIGWKISNMADGNHWNRAAFAYGSDETTGWSGTAAYLNGLWLMQQADKSPGRWGYWYVGEEETHGIEIAPQSIHFLCLVYKTQQIPNKAARLWLSKQGSTFFSNDHALLSSNGSWRMFVVIAVNMWEEVDHVKPLVRSFSPGQLWFDDVQVRRIYVETAPGRSDFPIIVMR